MFQRKSRRSGGFPNFIMEAKIFTLNFVNNLYSISVKTHWNTKCFFPVFYVSPVLTSRPRRITCQFCWGFFTAFIVWTWSMPWIRCLVAGRTPRSFRFYPRLFLLRTDWHGGRVQLKCDGTRWRTGEEVKVKLAKRAGTQYSSHYLGTWCIQHYYRWCAHLGCQ